MADILEQVKRLRQLYNGFQGARVLLTANNFRVFDHLKKQRTAKALASEIYTDSRATEILLDALTGLGLLKKQNSSYRNTNLASRFLVKGSPYYQGDIITHSSTLWDNWSGLDRIVKTGAPHRKSENHSAFIHGMHNLAVLKAKKIIAETSLQGVKRALDLGGGPGTYSMEMAKSGVHVTLFDSPETIKIARRIIRGEGLQNVDFIQGDFLCDDIGSGYDLILISQILHAYSAEDNIPVLKKCRKALNKKGRIVIQEFCLEEDRAYPVQGALFSINMLVNTKGGRAYSPGEIRNWLIKSGYKNINKKFISDIVLFSAEK